MASVNTGKFIQEKGDFDEVGYQQSRENDEIDSKYGFDRVKDTTERTGYLINMHSTEVLDEERRLVSALDLFFLQMDGSRFKVTVIFQPYLLVQPSPGYAVEVARYLGKKYESQISRLEYVKKEDLDLPNHLSGLQREYIQLFFFNNTAMMKVRRDILSIVRKNTEREKSTTHYMRMLSNSLMGGNKSSQESSSNQDYLDHIVDIREYDVPYHVRISIDLKVMCGLWYNVRCRNNNEMPVIVSRPDILERPEPVVFAYDIETTKLPLKFPDAQSDQIMMISYMIDNQGYLITNREIISNDVDDFEYTPKPEFEGNFIIFNEPNEKALLEKFFEHILDVRPHIFVTYNGDFFDWPFVDARATFHGLNMAKEIGFQKSKSREGNYYLCRPAMHMDCLCWVKRDSYLPVGSQGLKAVAKAKLRYDPVELDPEEMCKMAAEQPQVLANYSVSDAVATYYLYMKYVHPFIFALATIIPMEPDEILRKGSGTLCEVLLMTEAFHANIAFPNKQISELNKLSSDGHLLDSETYVGGHVEALESGVFRADIPTRFRIDPTMIAELQANVDKVLAHAIEVEEGVPLSECINLDEVQKEINHALQQLYDTPNRHEQPVIYHLDVGAMYPNIILTNRLQPSAMVDETDCAVCCFNRPDAQCKRNMEWMWRGEMLPASRNEFQRIQQQLETEKFPGLYPGAPQRAFHELSKDDQAAYEKKRLTDYCRTAYKKTKVTRLETRTSTICQMENSFYVDTVRAFRDRRYEYKGLTKKAKAAVSEAMASGDASEIKAAKGREVLYDSLQLAHKCILNSFYGYVMRRGARWHSMPMAGIVCLTGANIIKNAREIIERVGRPLELDTDGIWCILPGTFPQNFTVHTNNAKKKKLVVSYPNAVLNTMVKDKFTNDQYHELRAPPKEDKLATYEQRSENSIFFEVDGPYLAMVLPAAKEEGKKLKKRYAVFNFDGSIAELKGFEIKRRGELQLIKIFQSSVFESFLNGTTLEECYASVAKVADYWLDVLYSKGKNMPDSELFELISENRSMSKKLEDYGSQKSTSISTAKRLAEFLGDQMVKDAGLACKYIISRKPDGAPVTERAIPLAIFQSEVTIRRHYLKRWLKDNTAGDADIRDVLDWNYYIERLGGAIQKIITIPAALQGLSNPVPRIQHPDWLHKRVMEKNDVLKQRRINEIFKVQPKPVVENVRNNDPGSIMDIEDITSKQSTSTNGIPIVTKRKRVPTDSPDGKTPVAKTWREAFGTPPKLGNSRDEVIAWVQYQKKKWAWQAERRRQSRATGASKRSKMELVGAGKASKEVSKTLGGFMKRVQRNLLECSWQIIQIVPVDELGNFIIWAMIDDELHKIKLNVPRIFYVNQRSEAPAETNNYWKKVNRVLPRSRPVFNLYQFIVPEETFKEHSLGLLADLATPNIEGIYETQMTLEYRALISLGCVCSVQHMEAQRLIKLATKDIDSFSIDQLEMKTGMNNFYLNRATNYLEKIYLYHHNTPTGKREMYGLFITGMKKAIVIVHDTVKTNQMPNVKTMYTTERNLLLQSEEHNDESKLPPENIQFEILIETDIKKIQRHIQRAMSAYKAEKKNPTILCIQSAIPVNSLNNTIPVLKEFPQVQIHIGDDAALLSGLEWQRLGSRSMIRHYLGLNSMLDMMIDQCRYYQIPLGNMPTDTVIFGSDMCYARYLQKHNMLLWWSHTSRPDLGGREADDNRLLGEFDDNIIVVQNSPGYYPEHCVELALDSLAVTALLQTNRILETEGASSAITFDVIPQACVEDLLTKRNQLTPSSYDEGAACSAAFRVMRSMVSTWLKEVTLHRNIYSDFQIVQFYRWIRSSTAFLYDPALRRSLNNIMRKLFLQIISEFKRLGADIVYADFNRIIINSKKKTITDAIGYVDFVVQNIRNKEIFHSVQISYQQSWEFLYWTDTANYSGVKAKLPRELQNEETNDTESVISDDDKELDVNCVLRECLPEENDAREMFSEVWLAFLEQLAQNKTTGEAMTSISFVTFQAIQKLHKKYAMGRPSPALEFIKVLCKLIVVNESIEEEIIDFRRNMLRLIGIGEFSNLVKWTDPIKSYMITEVICKACNHCRDLDLCKDQHRALKNGLPVWYCSNCFVSYENYDIEMRIIDVVQRKIMTYNLQDLTCIRCKQVKRDNIAEYCSCAGSFDTLINPNEMKQLFVTFKDIATKHNMELLLETVEWNLKKICV